MGALGEIRRSWCPDAFVVSFKLETDETILKSKARGAIQKYVVDCVVANMLKSYNETCALVTETGFKQISRKGHPLERRIVKELSTMHKAHFETSKQPLTLDDDAPLNRVPTVEMVYAPSDAE